MTGHWSKRLRNVAAAAASGAAAAGLYVLVGKGALTIDLGLGRRVRPLGPIEITVDAPPTTVFDVIASPYLGRTPRAMREKLRVDERGSDMVLATHFTDVGPFTAATVEVVSFERPERVAFRLVRGPVPHVLETFELRDAPNGSCHLLYTGEIGADLWRLGQWWTSIVAQRWEETVRTSMQDIRSQAEGLPRR